MKTAFASTIFVVLASLPALANVPAMADRDASCIQNSQDRFDLGWRVAKEAPQSAGKCINTERIRAITLLAEDKENFEISSFLHKGRYWKARFAKDDVTRVSAMSVRFGEDVRYIRLAHVQTRFYFERGIQLIAPATGALGPVLKSAVVSWEAVFPVGEGFDLVTTLRRNVPIVGRVISAEQTLFENSPRADGASRVREVSLNLARVSANRLFMNHVHLSEARGFSLAYILLLRNCATNLFDILDSSVPTSAARFRTPWSYDPIEASTLAALKSRGHVAADANWVQVR